VLAVLAFCLQKPKGKRKKEKKKNFHSSATFTRLISYQLEHLICTDDIVEELVTVTGAAFKS
jgi:hypothetical protein